MAGRPGDSSLPRGPLWLPRGFRVGAWWGGPVLPPRAALPLRPVHASWLLPGPALLLSPTGGIGVCAVCA